MEHETERSGSEVISSLINSRPGYIMGLIPIPDWAQPVYRMIRPNIESWIGSFGEPKIKAGLSAAAKAAGFKNSEQIGYLGGRAFNYLSPYFEDVLNVSRTVSDGNKSKKELLKELAPLLAANKAQDNSGVVGNITNLFKGGFEGNDMVKFALKQVTHGTYEKLGEQAMGVIPKAVQFYKSKQEGIRDQAVLARGKLVGRLDTDPLMVANTLTIHDAEKNIATAGNWGIPLSSGISEAAAQAVRKKSAQKEKTSSLDIVLAIQSYIRDNSLDDPKTEASSTQIAQIQGAVEQAFQAFQKESGKHVIPTKRVAEVAKIITQDLVSGDLNALSLVNIIGRREMLNQKGDHLVGDDKISAVLKKEHAVFSKSSTVDVESFMSELDYTLDDVKTHTQSKDADERALVVLLHPDSVLLAAGMKQEQIADCRKHVSEKLANNIMVAIVADLEKRDNAELAEMGFDRNAISAIRYVGNDPQAIMDSLGSAREKEQLTAIARTAVMGEESTKWRNLVQQGKELTQSEKPAPRSHRERAERGNEEASYAGRY